MSSFSAPGYEIDRPTNACAVTGRVLQPGEAYYATLVETPPDPAAKGAAALGFKRVDVSPEAWNQGRRPEKLFSHWKSVVPMPNQKRRMFVDDEVLVGLLHRLGDDPQPQRQAFRFVLALILMRKKLLRYDGSRKADSVDEGGRAVTREYWLMVPRGDDRPIEVLNPHLDEEMIRRVTEQLGEVLNGEL